MADRPVVIVAGARTPIGKFGGVLRDLSAVELGSHAIRAAVTQSGIATASVDEAIVGHARQAGNGPNPGRLMALGAGLSSHAPCQTIQLACVSSMKALMLAMQSIWLGDSDVIAVGGSEHMSSIPFLVTDLRWGRRTGDAVIIDGLSKDGFRDPLTGREMGYLAEAWADQFGISREDQDAFAFQSQQRAAESVAQGFADRTIAPIEVSGRGDPVVVSQDEHPRPDTTTQRLAQLPSAFVDGGTVTAGNASGITDGAAAVLLASVDAAERMGAEPLAYVRSYAMRAMEPENFGLAVTPASQTALQRAGIGFDDLDVIEINEAFAVQVLASCCQMDLDPKRVNLHGGAIALGHPVGASGVRISYYAAEELAASGGRWALATICGNGGQAGAIVLENARP